MVLFAAIDTVVACDHTYTFEEIGWHDTVGADGRSAEEVVAANTPGPLSLVPGVVSTEAHPWTWDHLEWQFVIVPHPRRPPVRVTSGDPVNCPGLIVLPIVGAASSNGGIALQTSGAGESASWGVDAQGDDVPWRDLTSRVRLSDRGTVSVMLHIDPRGQDEATWPGAVDAALDAVLAPFVPIGFDPRTRALSALLFASPTARRLSLSVEARGEGDQRVQVGLASGVGVDAWP